MALSDAGPLADEADFSHLSTIQDGDFVTRTEFDLAFKQVVDRLIDIQIRSLKTNIGILEAFRKTFLKH